MDQATQLAQKLKQYATTLAASGREAVDEYEVEQWLGFWDDEESTYGNVRNIEHWLTQAGRRRRSWGRGPTEQR